MKVSHLIDKLSQLSMDADIYLEDPDTGLLLEITVSSTIVGSIYTYDRDYPVITGSYYNSDNPKSET